jgi:hypothetical protein
VHSDEDGNIFDKLLKRTRDPSRITILSAERGEQPKKKEEATTQRTVRERGPRKVRGKTLRGG